VPEPIRDKSLYDDTDRHLMAALQAVEVPADLRARIERTLIAASHEAEATSTSLVQSTLIVQSSKSRAHRTHFWNRRTVLAAAVAAGIGGLAFGLRQIFWQPLSQDQLVVITERLLNGLEKADWKILTEADAVAVRHSLQDVGFLRQVHNVALVHESSLEPLSNVQRVTAYKFNEDLVLLDLIIERGVQRVAQSLTQLPWGRSDMVAFAMSHARRTLIFVGPPRITDHILPPQTI
jgi:hypothetical protein